MLPMSIIVLDTDMIRRTSFKSNASIEMFDHIQHIGNREGDRGIPIGGEYLG